MYRLIVPGFVKNVILIICLFSCIFCIIVDKNALTRRLMNDNNQYELHINKLREVNGIKTHNVLIARTSETDESRIYINNPVESHIPYTFLTQEQFKQHLMDSIKKQQKEFSEMKLKNSLNRFQFKPKKKENKKPFVGSFLKTLRIKTKHPKTNLIKTSTKSISEAFEEELSSTVVVITRKETSTDMPRHLFTAKLISKTPATGISLTNTPGTTHRSASEDLIINNSESLIENYTDSRNYGRNFTLEYQEELNTTISDDTTATEDYERAFTQTNNTTSTIIITDTSVTETSEVTTTGTTKSTRSTRGVRFLFLCFIYSIVTFLG